MNDLIEAWNSQKNSSKKKHKKFIRRLQNQRGKHLNHWAEGLHDDVFKKIDCLDCANCCTSIPPMVNTTDVARIAKHLKMKPAEFQEKHLIQDEDGDWVMNASPCVFLKEDNSCIIYEHHPKACRQYPHTNNLEFSRNIHVHAANSMYCPAVFHILEQMMKRFPL